MESELFQQSTKDNDPTVLTLGDLLIPGAYSSFPYELLECGLSETAIVAALRMMKGLRKGDDAVCVASQVEMADRMGRTKKTTAKAIDELETAGIIAVERRVGGRSRYSFRPLEDWGAGEKPQSETRNPQSETENRGKKDTGVIITPGQNLPQTGVKSTPHQGKNYPAPLNSTCARHLVLTEEPPNPPQAGGSGGEDLHSDEEKKIESAFAVVDAAHREVFGVGMPAKWRRQIKREVQHGDVAIFDRIDAKVIRAADAETKRKDRTLGFGWILRAASTAKPATPPTPPDDDKKPFDLKREIEKAKDSLQDRRDSAISNLRLYWFRRQPEHVRADYIQSQSGGIIQRADIIEGMAAMAAWNDEYEKRKAI